MGSKSKSRFPAGSLDFRGRGILAFFQTAKMEDIRNFLSLGLSCTWHNGAPTMYALILSAEERQRIRSPSGPPLTDIEPKRHRIPSPGRFGTGLAAGAVLVTASPVPSTSYGAKEASSVRRGPFRFTFRACDFG